MRRRNSIAIAVSMVLVVTRIVAAQSQTRLIQQIEPRGGQRGTSLELTLTGYGLGTARELIFYRPGLAASKLRPTIHDQEGKSTLRVTLAIADDCPLGEHPIRVRSIGGITSLHTFYVGPYPHLVEVDRVTTFEEPQPLPPNRTLRGSIGAVGEVDWFSVTLESGQRLAVDFQAVRLAQGLFDGHVAIFDPKGRRVAECDDTGLGSQDPLLSILVPAAGVYRVAVRESGYGNEGSYKGPTGRYLLHVGNFPRPLAVVPAGGRPGEQLTLTFLGDAGGTFTQTIRLPAIADANFGFVGVAPVAGGLTSPTPHPLRVSEHDNVIEAEPNDDWAAMPSSRLPLPLAFNGVIEKNRDVDCFRFQATKGQRWVVQVFARRIRSQLDSVLSIHRVRDKASIQSNDDPSRRKHTSMFRYNTHHAGWYAQDSYLEWTVEETGEHVFRVTDQLKKGGVDFHYRIEATLARPHVTMWVRRNPPYWRATPGQSISVPRGNRYATMLSYRHRGCPADTRLRPARLPVGVNARSTPLTGRRVTTYGAAVPIVFEAEPDAPLGGVLTRFLAESPGGTRAIGTTYEQSVYYGLNPPNYCFYGVDNDRLAVGVCEEFPVRLWLVEPATPLVQEGELVLRIATLRDPKFMPPIRLELLYRPPGIAANQSRPVPPGAAVVEIPLEADRSAPTGSWPLVVVARTASQLHGGGVSTQVVPLDVIPPYVDVVIDRTVARPGRTTMLVVRIEQKVEFTGTATIELMGLPEGATASPVTFSSDDEKATFEVRLAADVSEGTHRTLFCRVTVPRQGGGVVHKLGRGGTLSVVESSEP